MCVGLTEASLPAPVNRKCVSLRVNPVSFLKKTNSTGPVYSPAARPITCFLLCSRPQIPADSRVATLLLQLTRNCKIMNPRFLRTIKGNSHHHSSALSSLSAFLVLPFLHELVSLEISGYFASVTSFAFQTSGQKNTFLKYLKTRHTKNVCLKGHSSG